jgi:hypothetical protein
MNLREIVAGLKNSSDETLIFAERIEGAFRPESKAMLLELSEAEFSESLDQVATKRAPGLEYFLEASIALEMLQGLRGGNCNEEIGLDKSVNRIIQYAENDA